MVAGVKLPPLCALSYKHLAMRLVFGTRSCLETFFEGEGGYWDVLKAYKHLKPSITPITSITLNWIWLTSTILSYTKRSSCGSKKFILIELLRERGILSIST